MHTKFGPFDSAAILLLLGASPQQRAAWSSPNREREGEVTGEREWVRLVACVSELQFCDVYTLTDTRRENMHLCVISNINN